MPAHLLSLNHTNNIGWGVQIIKLMWFSPFPCYLSLLGPNTIEPIPYQYRIMSHSQMSWNFKTK
jgi:hypothetical protein